MLVGRKKRIYLALQRAIFRHFEIIGKPVQLGAEPWQIIRFDAQASLLANVGALVPRRACFLAIKSREGL